MEHILALEREEEFLAAALRYAVGLAQGHTAALLTLANAHSVSTRMTILGAGIPPTVFSSPEIQQTALQALAQGAVFAVPSRQLKDTQFVAAPVSAEEDQTLALGAFVPVTVSQASTQMAFQLATQLFERRRQRNERNWCGIMTGLRVPSG